MRITNSGHVGIGTTEPDHPLLVRGLVPGDAIVFRHGTEPGRAALTTGNAGMAGAVATRGLSGNINAAMAPLGQNSDHGVVAVFDAAQNEKAFMLVHTDGRGFVVADVKSFRVPNPGQPGTDIVYAGIEGPEAAAYARGTARLRNGEAVVDLPEHFAHIASERGLTVQLTASSAQSRGLAAEKKSPKRLVVRELRGGKGNYEFDWEVKSIRKGYEDYRVIRPHNDLAIGVIDQQDVREKAK
jgi:hypothetical protein